MKSRGAVIGGGVAGVAAAYHLCQLRIPEGNRSASSLAPSKDDRNYAIHFAK